LRTQVPLPETRVALQPEGQLERTPLFVPLHVIAQPPPGQVAAQLPVLAQETEQPPAPPQENTQFDVPAHTRVHPPAGQS
jgi:hypothetical protein